MRSINVCFSTSDKLLSRIIRWVTRSQVSHALITFYDETLDKVFVLEANGRGYMLIPWSKWRRSHTLVARYELDIPPKERERGLRYMANYLGNQYDFKSLPGFLWRRFVKRCKNPLDNPTLLICSEAVAMLLYHTGNSFLKVFCDYGSWTPEDIFEEVTKNEVFLLKEDNRKPTT